LTREASSGRRSWTGFFEYKRSSDELLCQVKKSTEGANEDIILRMEILDGPFEYKSSSDELLRQVKKTQRELTRTAFSGGRSWTASMSLRGYPMNFFAIVKNYKWI
jgi:hypothetical protein